MDFRLISFVLCPYVQRAVIMLLFKGVKHQLEYIDLSDKPDWFLEISPRGKVPVLVANQAAIFESQAICEFLDETLTDKPLMPAQALARAKARQWFAVASEDLFGPLHKLCTTSQKKAGERIQQTITATLDHLSEDLGDKDFLSTNNQFGMADLAVAPFLFRAQILRGNKVIDLLADHDNILRWAQRLLALDYIKNSVRNDFTEQLISSMDKADSYLLS